MMIGAVMTALGITIIVLQGVSYTSLAKTINDDFSCSDSPAGCGVFGDELKRHLRRLRDLVLWSFIIHLVSFFSFLWRSYISDLGQIAKWMLFVTTVAAYSLTSLACGAVSFNTLGFLKDNAVAESWSYSGNISTINGLQWVSFAIILLLSLVGMQSSRPDRRRCIAPCDAYIHIELI